MNALQKLLLFEAFLISSYRMLQKAPLGYFLKIYLWVLPWEITSVLHEEPEWVVCENTLKGISLQDFLWVLLWKAALGDASLESSTMGALQSSSMVLHKACAECFVKLSWGASLVSSSRVCFSGKPGCFLGKFLLGTRASLYTKLSTSSCFKVPFAWVTGSEFVFRRIGAYCSTIKIVFHKTLKWIFSRLRK